MEVKKRKRVQYLSAGILDIYGFEIYRENSSEQLCINYCNEKLQQLFTELLLKNKQDDYSQEGLNLEPISFFNNKIICDLFEGRPGIFPVIDECILLAESDVELLDSLDRHLGKHPNYSSANTNKVLLTF
jgi:myosin-1